jgi:hypothetical protein
VIGTVTAGLWSSAIVIAHVPFATGVTVKIAFGPFAEAGENVATAAVHVDVALNVPEYDASLTLIVWAAGVPRRRDVGVTLNAPATVTFKKLWLAFWSTTEIVVVPDPTAVTVNVAVGPFCDAGLTVATPGLKLLAVSGPA